VEGVLAVHEFHVWQLAGNRIIASAHIRCMNLRDYMRIAEEVKSFFHNEGIHSTTIQPEFVEASLYTLSLCLSVCLSVCLSHSTTIQPEFVEASLSMSVSMPHSLCLSVWLWCYLCLSISYFSLSLCLSVCLYHREYLSCDYITCVEHLIYCTSG